MERTRTTISELYVLSSTGVYTVTPTNQIQRLSFRYGKRYLKLAFPFDDLLSQKFTVLARRLYGRFSESFFVGRELGTEKLNTKMVSHMHSRVINNESTCFEFFSIQKCIDSCTPKTGTRLLLFRCCCFAAAVAVLCCCVAVAVTVAVSLLLINPLLLLLLLLLLLCRCCC